MAVQPNPTNPGAIPKATKSSKKSNKDEEDQLTEKFQQFGVTDGKKYNIASVNFMGTTTAEGTGEKRKAHLRKLLGKKLPHVSIVFVQECPWVNKNVIKKLELQDNFRYKGEKREAGIIWDRKLFKVERLKSNKIGDEYPSLKEHRGRLCICKFTTKGQPEQHVSSFIAISWHGPHKCKDEEKKKVFKDLLKLVQTYDFAKEKKRTCLSQANRKNRKEDSNGPKCCLIGGDFNFSSDEAREIIDRHDGLDIAAFKSNGSGRIDYFIFTSDVHDAQQLSLKYDEKTEQDIDIWAKDEAAEAGVTQILDHKPIFAVLDLGRL